MVGARIPRGSRADAGSENRRDPHGMPGSDRVCEAGNRLHPERRPLRPPAPGGSLPALVRFGNLARAGGGRAPAGARALRGKVPRPVRRVLSMRRTLARVVQLGELHRRRALRLFGADAPIFPRLGREPLRQPAGFGRGLGKIHRLVEPSRAPDAGRARGGRKRAASRALCSGSGFCRGPGRRAGRLLSAAVQGSPRGRRAGDAHRRVLRILVDADRLPVPRKERPPRLAARAGFPGCGFSRQPPRLQQPGSRRGHEFPVDDRIGLAPRQAVYQLRRRETFPG